MKPRKVEYDVGKDVHGRTVLLIYEADHPHRPSAASWTIHRLAANQRDEDSIILGLTPESILAMADAVKDSQRSEAR